MNRHTRRADLHDFKRAGSLWTFLVAPNDVRLRGAPLLQKTADRWLDLLTRQVRACIVCSQWLIDREHVGLVLLAAPATARPSTASCCGVCRGCADAELPIAALERACEIALRVALPNGRFEPDQDAHR